ncbi:MAG: ClpXP protease specificity-enhancing factor [Betaproteobacteria bacterium]|jgi:stringent starvation protein B|nr:ClpXP protease specificity-enhancing factor [Betaproteobacteria bacterium]MDH5343897.1 ClpXP protease specificity-enhancing factor [Betaproteobacteria bacterium]
MAERSTKPYLIRAVHEWACDSGLTPYLSVRVDEHTRVPAEHVKDGEIMLNVSYDATHKLTIDNDLIRFSARFGGVSRECSVPVAAVQGIFAKENGQGLFFPAESEARSTAPDNTETMPAASGKPEDPKPDTPAPGGRPRLQVVK